jgi:pimeloyl-ACP methyl ester carboxylesterase
VLVPLDYQDPGGPTVSLAVTKVDANGDAIGSIFVNPGGPGGSAFDYAKAADFILSADVREVYNVVGVDPRGVGLSDPVRCLTDAQLDEFTAADGTPDTPQEEETVIEDSAKVAELCAQKGGRLAGHMGTADAARDLDIVRAVLGEQSLNMMMKSYGTALGVTYMGLFPEHVGRSVLDGVLPSDLSNVEVSKGQAEAFEVALADFAEFCVESGECPVDGDAEDVVAGIQVFFDELDENPLPTQDDRPLTQSLAQFAVLSYLYFPSSDYPLVLSGLTSALRDGDGTELLTMLDERRSRSPDGRYLDNSSDAFYLVTCTDDPFTGSDEEVAALADDWSKTAPTYGAALAWGLLVCRDWPVEARASIGLTDLDDIATAPLIVATRHDPATPIQWAERLHQALPKSGLVVWEDFNHTAYREGSDCVDEVVDGYFLTGDLPAEPVLCS